MCILENVPRDQMPREIASQVRGIVSQEDLRPSVTLNASAGQNDTSNHRLQSHIVIPLTANSKVSLQEMIKRLLIWLETRTQAASHVVESQFLTDVAYTLSERRTMMPWRFAVVTSTESPDMLRSSLEVALSSLSLSSLSRTVTQRPPVFYIFTGQGAQWYAMGRELMHISTVFRDSIAKSAKFLVSFGAQWSPLEELERNPGTTRVYDSEIGQPCSTAIQIALVDILTFLGVKPSNVIGHSSGEIVAAYASQAISHEDAIKISYTRGFLSNRARDTSLVAGSMIAVDCAANLAEDCIRQVKSGRLVVACLNSPSNVTISGDEPAIEELEELLSYKDVSFKRLKVDTAYHSHHMEAVAQSYLDDLARLGGIRTQPSASDVRFISTVTGQVKNEEFDATYWVRNLLSPVKFHEALGQCRQLRVEGKGVARLPRHIFLEVGPHHALERQTKTTLKVAMPGKNRKQVIKTWKRC